jgi:hypothetical protein
LFHHPAGNTLLTLVGANFDSVNKGVRIMDCNKSSARRVIIPSG